MDPGNKSRTALTLVLLGVPLALAGCATSDYAGTDNGPSGSDSGACVDGNEPISQAGSSTVLPIALAWAETFERCIGAKVSVSGGGSGAGFQKFCRREIDIANGSRPIKESEAAACRAVGIEPFEVEVAVDGLAVVVSKSNTFATNLTVAELNRIWTADGTKQASRWSDVRDGWPDEKILLYGPGTDSGTFDYFREAIIHPFDGSSATTRSDFVANEDDNALVNGIRQSRYAMGYFGIAYVEANQGKIRAVPVDDGKDDNGAGAVLPTPENVEAGTYQPLARPLFMYVNGKPMGAVQRYFQAGLSDEGQHLVAETGYVPLPNARLEAMRAGVA